MFLAEIPYPYREKTEKDVWLNFDLDSIGIISPSTFLPLAICFTSDNNSRIYAGAITSNLRYSVNILDSTGVISRFYTGSDQPIEHIAIDSNGKIYVGIGSKIFVYKRKD